MIKLNKKKSSVILAFEKSLQKMTGCFDQFAFVLT